MDKSFSIITSRTGAEPLTFRGVNILLGANGTGKTKFLAEIKSLVIEALPDYSVLNIEGGRAIVIANSLALNNRNFQNHRNYDQTIRGYKNKRAGTLQSRIFDALKSLEQTSEKYKADHSDAVMAWNAQDRKDEEGNPVEVPLRKIDPMSTVFEAFSDIFPTIELKYIKESQTLACIKDGEEYVPSQLSDGEKQVFSVLVDIIELSEKESVLLVDEPELNLNPGLANRVWNTIEGILPDAIFIYATHSVNFALRESVDLLLVLSNENQNIQEISDFHELSRRDQEELLGNLPGLIENKTSLVVEGDDDSFDAVFYDWILNDGGVSPKAVGGCEDVRAIVQREGKWQKISPNARLVGVVDRDYKPDTHLSTLSGPSMVALEFHEAESYLCLPELLVKVSQALQTVEKIPDESVIEQKILEFCARERLATVARRVSSQLQHRIGVSVPSSVLRRINTEEQLKSLIIKGAEFERKKVENVLDDSAIERIFDSEILRIDRAISDGALIDLLQLFPGKEMLKLLSPIVGCVSVSAVARAARHHLDLGDFSPLVSLRANITSKIQSADKTQ